MTALTTAAQYVPPTGLRRTMRRIKWLARYQGLPATALSVGIKTLSKCGIDFSRTDWYTRYKSRLFDKRFRVETAQAVQVEQLDFDAARKEHAVEYDPTSSTEFALVLSGLQIDFQDYAFIDFGSGKGRVLLMASEFPFGLVRGVELSPTLHNVAESNIAKYRSKSQRCTDVCSMCADATEFEFPDRPLVLYFFNPFGPVILRSVLARLEASVRRNPRNVFVIYHNPLHRDLMDDATFLDSAPGEQDDWLVFQHRSMVAT